MPNGLRNGLVFAYADLASVDVVGNLPAPSQVGTVTFGPGAIPGETEATFTGAGYLTLAVAPGILSGYGTQSFWVTAIVSSLSPGSQMVIFMVGCSVVTGGSGLDGLILWIQPDGTAYAEIPGVDGTFTINAASVASICDGYRHRVTLRWIVSTKTLALFVDNLAPVELASAVGGGATDDTNQAWIGAAGTLDRLFVGTIGSLAGGLNVDLTDSQISSALWANGNFLAIADFDTGSVNPPPNAPSGLSLAVASDTQINATWTDNSSNETGFKIELKAAGGSYSQIHVTAANATSYSITGLTAGTTYSVRVRAYDADGNSAYCTEQTATTTGGVPLAPSGLSLAVLSMTAITARWTNNATNAVNISLERKAAGGSYAEIVLLAPTATTYADSGLSSATTYFYRLRSVNGTGYSAYSAEVSGRTFGGTTPALDPIKYGGGLG